MGCWSVGEVLCVVRVDGRGLRVWMDGKWFDQLASVEAGVI